MKPPVTDAHQPQLDEKVWRAWLEKGEHEEKVAARKYRIVGITVAVLAAGYYFLTAAK